MPAIDGYTVANVKPSSTLASWHARDSPHIVLHALERDHLREGVDCRALEERRNEALQGRSQDFSKEGPQQGHLPGIADCIWLIPLLSLVYQRAQSYYRGIKALIN